MNKASLVRNLSKRLQIEKTTASIFLDAVLDEIVNACADGNDVKLTNFGQFETHDTPGGMRKNPRTGESVQVGPNTKMRFRPAQYFKDRVAHRGSRHVESPNATITY